MTTENSSCDKTQPPRDLHKVEDGLSQMEYVTGTLGLRTIAMVSGAISGATSYWYWANKTNFWPFGG